MILLRRFGTIRVFATDLDKPTAADPCTDGGCGDHRQGVGKVDGRLSDLRGIWRVGAGAARPDR